MNSQDPREQIISLLQSYRSIDFDDEVARGRFVEFVIGEPACFDRATAYGHLTGSAWVVSPDHNRVLLTFHKKLNKWLQLGGHADSCSDLLTVALREAQEESGLDALEPLSAEIFDLDLHEIPEHKGVPKHLHFDVRFVIEARGDLQFRVSSESHDLAWVDLNRLEDYSREPGLLRMRAKFHACY